MKPGLAHRRQIAWLTLGAVAAIGALLLGARAVHRHGLTVRSLPERPAPGSWPAALADPITHQEQLARGYIQPVTGLAALSRLYHANGFYPQALQCYDGLQQLEPGEARWLHLHASILAEFGRLDEARPLEQRAVELAADYIPARVRLGDILLKAGQTALAGPVYTAVLERDTGNPYALLGLARCAIAQGDWSRAREHLRQAITHHPDFVGALSLLVTVDERLGETAEIPALRAALGNREFLDLPDAWLDGLADACYDPYRLSVAAAQAGSAGDVATARRRLEQAIALAPDAGAYRRQLAAVLTREGNLPLARTQLEKAVTVAPDDADSWLQLVQNLAAQGEPDNAAQTLDKALAACPQSPSLHLEHARFFNRAGRPDDAIAEFRESYRLRPSEASPLVELASVYFTVGRVDEAKAALLEALRKLPDHPIALATLSLIAISQNDESGARGWWNRLRRQADAPSQVADTVRQAFQQQFGRNLP